MAKNKAAVVAPVAVRQRIVRTVLIPARELKANAKNFRRHGDEQRRDVAALLDGIGQVAPVIGRDMPDGSVQLLDGHLRTDLADDREILVAVTDLNDAEAATVLAMLDYTASLATIDPALAAALAVDAKASGVVSEESWAAWETVIGVPLGGGEYIFTPNTQPEADKAAVTAEQIDAAGDGLAARFDGEKGPELVEVTCPHCGQVFGLDART